MSESPIRDRLATALADRYRIERQLGQGGMATVYLAEDLKHDRKVAIKVLRPELAAVLGADRFVQEIKTTAALQHPHILPLFDSGAVGGLPDAESPGRRAAEYLYYVMPYVEGETLRARLDREKQLGIDEAVKITTSVADALDYAHRHGVIHRDIKPENILLHDGRPMVADFGIALAVSAAAGGRMTETGLSLGTPHYMSPEQATADRDITARSDVYSLASVLYEMLAGEPPHMGNSAQQIIMKIVTDTARPVTELRKSVPPNVAAAVAQALEKLPADRFASAAAFSAALGDSGFVTAGTSARSAVLPSARRSVLVRAAVVVPWVLLLAVGSWATWRVRQRAPEQVGHYALALDSTVKPVYYGPGTPARLALSPDGGTIVYTAVRLDPHLFSRDLDALAPRALTGTEEAFFPAVSPDGTQVAFLQFRSGSFQLLVSSLQGGPTLALTEVGEASTPAWGPGDYIYFVDSGSVLRRIPGGGGTAESVVTLPALGQGSSYRDLVVLPSGRGALVTEYGPNRPTDARLHVVDLRTGAVALTLQGAWGRHVPEADALVYAGIDGTLMAVPFDEGALRVRGRPVGVFGGIAVRYGAVDLAVGGPTLAYLRPGTNADEHLFWVDRATGRETPVDPAWQDTEYEAYALSPEGRRLAVSIFNEEGRRYDVWIKQLDHGPLSRLTFGGSRNETPAWTADGRYVSYNSERDGRWSLWRRRADGVGGEELVADVGRDILDAAWSRAGDWLVVCVGGGRGAETGRDILAMRLGTDSTLRPLLAEPHDEFKPRLSPDGRWLAYVSMEAGPGQVFVRPFPEVQQGKWQISREGGTDPAWSASGRELYFRSLDGQAVYATDMTRGPGSAAPTIALGPSAGSQREWNETDQMFSVSSDGRRFLFSIAKTSDQSGDLVIVQNFLTLLRTTLAGAR